MEHALAVLVLLVILLSWALWASLKRAARSWYNRGVRDGERGVTPDPPPGQFPFAQEAYSMGYEDGRRPNLNA